MFIWVIAIDVYRIKAKIDHFNSNNNFPVNGNGGNIQNNKILLSPKLKPYLTTFKSNIS